MNRLAFAIHAPAELLQASTLLLNGEGLCACGRLLRPLDGKFILTNVVPTKQTMIVAAYCEPCSVAINRTLKRCHRVTYDKQTPTAPIDTKMKLL